MKIILTCGHPDSGFQLAHAAFIAAGLSQALPSRRESLSSDAFQANILKAYDQDPAGYGCKGQISPGKVWQELAVDLFMGNMAQEAWGWADARTVFLLDFWKDFDPQIGFVLVYSSPEFAVGQALRNKPATPAEIDRVIASWTACNTEILRFYNRHPDQCLLVNASAVIHTPAKLVEQCAARLGITIELAASAHLADSSQVSAIASSLAKALIEDRDEAMALYRELESSADLDSGPASISDAQNCQAWQEYSTLLSGLDQAVAMTNKQQAHIERLGLERDEQARLAAERQNQIGQISKTLDEQTALAGERQRLIQQLTHDRDEHAKWHLENKQWAEGLSAEKIQLEQQLALITHGRDEQARLADERYLLIQQLTAQLGELQMSLEARQSDPDPLQYQELMHENELLLLQLHQVQEELEHYLLQNQELINRTQSNSGPAAFTAEFWRRHQPAEILIDMRQEIEGDNWYYAEHDGRWAGPHELSTIRLPALRDGHYELVLDVVDAKEPEILAGMIVSLNGIPLEMTMDGEGVMALVYAEFSTQSITKSPVWEFQFKFHKLISPAQHGSEDRRNLAIRLQSLKLGRIE